MIVVIFPVSGNLFLFALFASIKAVQTNKQVSKQTNRKQAKTIDNNDSSNKLTTTTTTTQVNIQTKSNPLTPLPLALKINKPAN